MTAISSDVLFDRLAAAAREGVEQHGVPGLVLGVQLGEERRVLPLGATTTGGTQVGEGTLFRWCSITKVVVTVLALGLVDDGAIELDAPIGAELGDLGHPDRAQITPRMLLMHTSGLEGEWPESLEVFGGDDDALGRAVSGYGRLRQLARPGLAWGYCNPGFWLLGRLIEVRLGVSIEAAVRRRVLEPSSLHDTITSLDDLGDRELAEPYAREIDGRTGRPRRLDHSMPRARFASGGLMGSTADLLAFGRSQIAVAGRFDRIGAESVVAESVERRQGLGWIVERIGERTLFDHSGFFAGYASQLSVVPERGLVVSVLGNSVGAWDVREAVHDEMRAILGRSASPRPADRGEPELGAYDYPELERLALVAASGGVRLRAVGYDGEAEESGLEPLEHGGYRVLSGEFAGCELYALPGHPGLIRLAERLGRRHDDRVR